MELRRVAHVTVALGLAACGGSRAHGTYDPGTGSGSVDVGDPNAMVGGGRFSRRQIAEAIRDEKQSIAKLDERIGDTSAKLDAAYDDDTTVVLASLRADRVAATSFVAQLEQCLDEPGACPPSLDVPQVPSDFDVTTGEFAGKPVLDPSKWAEASAAIEKSACGCRSSSCVLWVTADIDRWEAALSEDDQADEAAAAHVTGARECLFARLGERPIRPALDDSAE